MKVFLSWSGEQSHNVAVVFRDWFPLVIQSLIPYVSSEDIDKGARWSTEIATELEKSTFGILCVTKENLNAPWLNFEAGALSKTMDKSFVSPFLFNIKRSEVNGPILQFQSTVFEKEDIKKLLKTLNNACGVKKLTSGLLDQSFETWYPVLEEKFNKVLESEVDGELENKRTKESRDNEILVSDRVDIQELIKENKKLKNEIAKLKKEKTINNFNKTKKSNQDTILLVDDMEAIHLLYREELEERKFNVYSVYSGEEAIETFFVLSPDLVILDIKMPGINGLEVLREIRTKDKETPIILCSAYSDYMSDLDSWGAHDYIIKSSNLNQLFETIEKYLPGKQK